MDCEMPEMDGYEATREIRRREGSWGRIPIVALTGRAMAGAESECREAGMDGYLVKPFERGRLEACLDRILGCDSIETTGERPIVQGTALTSRDFEDRESLLVLANGDDSFMKELIGDFLVQADAAFPQLSEALRTRDPAALARTAHALKTSAGAFHAEVLRGSVEQLESSAREGKVDRSLIENVRQHLTVAVERLRTWAA
jgi:CheY-like chemotaxis protein